MSITSNSKKTLKHILLCNTNISVTSTAYENRPEDGVLEYYPNAYDLFDNDFYTTYENNPLFSKNKNDETSLSTMQSDEHIDDNLDINEQLLSFLNSPSTYSEGIKDKTLREIKRVNTPENIGKKKTFAEDDSQGDQENNKLIEKNNTDASSSKEFRNVNPSNNENSTNELMEDLNKIIFYTYDTYADTDKHTDEHKENIWSDLFSCSDNEPTYTTDNDDKSICNSGMNYSDGRINISNTNLGINNDGIGYNNYEKSDNNDNVSILKSNMDDTNRGTDTGNNDLDIYNNGIFYNNDLKDISTVDFSILKSDLNDTNSGIYNSNDNLSIYNNGLKDISNVDFSILKSNRNDTNSKIYTSNDILGIYNDGIGYKDCEKSDNNDDVSRIKSDMGDTNRGTDTGKNDLDIYNNGIFYNSDLKDISTVDFSILKSDIDDTNSGIYTSNINLGIYNNDFKDISTVDFSILKSDMDDTNRGADTSNTDLDINNTGIGCNVDDKSCNNVDLGVINSNMDDTNSGIYTSNTNLDINNEGIYCNVDEKSDNYFDLGIFNINMDDTNSGIYASNTDLDINNKGIGCNVYEKSDNNVNLGVNNNVQGCPNNGTNASSDSQSIGNCVTGINSDGIGSINSGLYCNNSGIYISNTNPDIANAGILYAASGTGTITDNTGIINSVLNTAKNCAYVTNSGIVYNVGEMGTVNSNLGILNSTQGYTGSGINTASNYIYVGSSVPSYCNSGVNAKNIHIRIINNAAGYTLSGIGTNIGELGNSNCGMSINNEGIGKHNNDINTNMLIYKSDDTNNEHSLNKSECFNSLTDVARNTSSHASGQMVNVFYQIQNQDPLSENYNKDKTGNSYIGHAVADNLQCDNSYINRFVTFLSSVSNFNLPAEGSENTDLAFFIKNNIKIYAESENINPFTVILKDLHLKIVKGRVKEGNAILKEALEILKVSKNLSFTGDSENTDGKPTTSSITPEERTIMRINIHGTFGSGRRYKKSTDRAYFNMFLTLRHKGFTTMEEAITLEEILESKEMYKIYFGLLSMTLTRRFQNIKRAIQRVFKIRSSDIRKIKENILDATNPKPESAMDIKFETQDLSLCYAVLIKIAKYNFFDQWETKCGNYYVHFKFYDVLYDLRWTFVHALKYIKQSSIHSYVQLEKILHLCKYNATKVRIKEISENLVDKKKSLKEELLKHFNNEQSLLKHLFHILYTVTVSIMIYDGPHVLSKLDLLQLLQKVIKTGERYNLPNTIPDSVFQYDNSETFYICRSCDSDSSSSCNDPLNDSYSTKNKHRSFISLLFKYLKYHLLHSVISYMHGIQIEADRLIQSSYKNMPNETGNIIFLLVPTFRRLSMISSGALYFYDAVHMKRRTLENLMHSIAYINEFSNKIKDMYRLPYDITKFHSLPQIEKGEIIGKLTDIEKIINDLEILWKSKDDEEDEDEEDCI